ncbi:unnamed protein product [Orchesella dallaii]|uniref:Transposable element P transposase n=1 Tax=Orchesella dallaii TaxID=48710 RepID=A0ABP1RKN3_9HEXA
MKIKELKTTIKNLRHRLKINTIQTKTRKTKKSSMFSPAQKKKLAGQKRVNWKTNDIVKALSLRSVNQKAYETARLQYNLPLPAPRTLRRWVHRFTCSPGLLHDVIEIMRDYGSDLDIMSRLCALSFDEMSSDSRFIVDPVSDKIVSHSKVQLVMARGICEKWKQPIFYDFDAPMTTEILESIIIALESAGFPVVSVTCDLGGENRSIWKKYGIGLNKSWFLNPFDKTRRIYMFADIPHMLKLIRNHLLDDGFITNNGTVIDRRVFQTLVNSAAGELTVCPKLTHHLIEVTGAERMRVRPAAQLLSHHSATLARKVFPFEPEIAQFIQTMNDSFDVFNSRVPVDGKNPLSSGFGFQLEEQTRVLLQLKEMMLTGRFFMKGKSTTYSTEETINDEVEEEVQDNNLAANSSRVDHRRPRNSLLPCQIGYIVSVNSLFGLYEDLKNVYGVSYILCSRLLQDSLESLFSRIRGFGGQNTNPTPPEFRYRLRLVLLGGQVRAPQGMNVLSHCSSSYISTELLERNKINCTVNTLADTSVIPPKMTRKNFQVTPQTEDALTYLAGYLAWKLKRKCPTLKSYGQPTATLPAKEVPNWIHSLSRGGLLAPDAYILEAVKKCNAIFEASMKDFLQRSNLHSNLITRLESEIPGLEKQIINEFVKIRIKIRIKALNNGRTNSMINRRKAKQFLHSTKS